MSLTPDQKGRLEELRRKFLGENAELIGALVARKLEFHSLWSDSKADPKAIMDKGRELASVQAQLKERILRVMVDARSFLTPEQINHVKRRWFSHRGMMARHGADGDRMMGQHGGMMSGHREMMGHREKMEQRGGEMKGQGGGMSGHGGGMQGGCPMMGGGGMSGHGSGGTTGTSIDRF